MTVVSLVDRDGWIAKVLESTAILPAAKNVAVRIALHVHRQTGDCYPSIATIAAGAGLTVRPVEKAIATLEKAGWLVRERDTRRRSNTYRLTYPEGVTPVSRDGVETSDPVPRDGCNPVSRDGVGLNDPVSRDGVRGSDPVPWDGSTPSHGTDKPCLNLKKERGGRANHEPDRSKGQSGKVAIAKDDPRWADAAAAFFRLKRHQPPIANFAIGGQRRDGWIFDRTLIDREPDPVPPGDRHPYADAAE